MFELAKTNFQDCFLAPLSKFPLESEGTLHTGFPAKIDRSAASKPSPLGQNGGGGGGRI